MHFPTKKREVKMVKKFKTRDDLSEIIEAYKKDCEIKEKPPTLAGLAYHAGLNRRSLYNYSLDDEFSDLIDDFKAYVVMILEDLALTQRGNVGGVIFILKNYGYSDKTTMIIDQAPFIEVKWTE